MCDQIEAAMKQSKQASQSTEEEEEKVSSALHCFALHVLQVRVAVRGEA